MTPTGNPTLYDAIQKAKKSSVPNDNIDRAVKRGSGAETGGADYQTIMYEGYGPAGVAMLIECLTDNRNRAAMEVRTAMTRNGGSLADPGSVSFLFNRKGVVIVPVDQEGKTVTEDDILEATLEAGADEVNDLGEAFEVVSEADRPGRRAHRAAGGRHRLRLRRGVVRPGHAGRARPGRGRPRCSGSSTPSRTSTTCRTSSPTRRVRRGHGGAWTPERSLGDRVTGASRGEPPTLLAARARKVQVVVGPSISRRASGAARASILATARLSLPLKTSMSATPWATRSSVTALASAVPIPRR